jgi:hypothetical protein
VISLHDHCHRLSSLRIYAFESIKAVVVHLAQATWQLGSSHDNSAFAVSRSIMSLGVEFSSKLIEIPETARWFWSLAQAWKLHNAYTFFRPKHQMIPNCLDRMFFFPRIWMGDLLVVKYGHQNMSKIVDMEPEDQALVNHIIKW